MNTIRQFTILCGLFAAAFQLPATPQEAPMTQKKAGEIFAERCVTCHVAPDLAYATDRAWIAQVNETA